MATLINQVIGGKAHRCDSRCHNAVSPGCDCICGGVLHGSGDRAKAVLATAVWAARLLEQGGVKLQGALL